MAVGRRRGAIMRSSCTHACMHQSWDRAAVLMRGVCTVPVQREWSCTHARMPCMGQPVAVVRACGNSFIAWIVKDSDPRAEAPPENANGWGGTEV